MDYAADDNFFNSLPVLTQFEGVADSDNYRPLPEGWVLALADIVGSTKEIEAGRYKDVNMAGASVISAVLNAVDKGDYPFVFGGDGALIALPAALTGQAREALAAVRTWAWEEFRLALRVALVPMRDVHAQGLDVRVARYAASPFVSYAMFTGGGTSWAEAQMKAGKYDIDPAPAGTRPDLTGLSCRWSPIQAHNGEIVSIIAVPDGGRPSGEFQDLVTSVIAIASEQGRGGHPVPLDGPEVGFSLAAIRREVRATAPKGRRFLQGLWIAFQIGLLAVLLKLRAKLLGFDAINYRHDLVENSDFRKFDDGLKMTIDVDAGRLQRIEALLEDSAGRGVARYGLHCQTSALMTCFVPTPLSRDHIHFIDGADGGYAMAASRLKGRSQTATQGDMQPPPDQTEAGAAITL
ncbi:MULTISPECIES: DUF3095 domain-containing protein [unclassified Sinorhizobium]|uniref:DUF3095 domain-containing protein n=1 Tax=unclassified Sinorhizobium TaxID=2613772 RepID=UPI0035240AF5